MVILVKRNAQFTCQRCIGIKSFLAEPFSIWICEIYGVIHSLFILIIHVCYFNNISPAIYILLVFRENSVSFCWFFFLLLLCFLSYWCLLWSLLFEDFFPSPVSKKKTGDWLEVFLASLSRNVLPGVSGILSLVCSSVAYVFLVSHCSVCVFAFTVYLMHTTDTRLPIFHQLTSCLCNGIFNTLTVTAFIADVVKSYLQSYFVFLYCSSLPTLILAK